jgi:hypothetical protein
MRSGHGAKYDTRVRRGHFFHAGESFNKKRGEEKGERKEKKEKEEREKRKKREEGREEE